MNFNSIDFGSETPPTPSVQESVRPQRRRALFGTMLAAVIAFIVIAIVLAIISALGERRLSLLHSPSPVTVVAPTHSNRATPGLLAPPSLPSARAVPPTFGPPQAPASECALVAAPPVTTPLRQAQQASAALTPVVLPLAPPTPQQIRKTLAALPFTRIHDAFLWKPYTEPNPTLLQRPMPGEDLMQLRQASRLSPEAARSIVEQRRPQGTLAQLRAQAAMNRAAATTRPSS